MGDMEAMPTDYAKVRCENELRYGTDSGRIGRMLMSERYADRTQFIFELLQNAEDALARRNNWVGPRKVQFTLSADMLRVSHYGKPFDEADVRAICGIALSTKEKTAIGRFGIGFKSVYALTDRPEIHSGDEDFAIENFVWPVASCRVQRSEDETVIILPLREGDEQGFREISGGLRGLGPRVLLFLKEIDRIEWSIEGGLSGSCWRISEELDSNVSRVTVVSEKEGEPRVEERWLVFSRRVPAKCGEVAAHRVEIAFKLENDSRICGQRIVRLDRSPLVVYFPTAVETHLGFLVQGPYHTTPSRDNVIRNDPWNRSLVKETAVLLVKGLYWLRDRKCLDTGAFSALPLDNAKFADDSMFAPVFVAVTKALQKKRLLPRYDGGYVKSSSARLARTPELLTLLSPHQLTHLVGETSEVAWLSGDIAPDTTPEIWRYLVSHLGVEEITLETVIHRLSKSFLEAQPDDWILRLYGVLYSQPVLRYRLENVPIIRLENGEHVVAKVEGRLQAYLPGKSRTGFPTVRRSVCRTEEACKFLQSLGLTEPKPSDDVIRNVLPKYMEGTADIDDGVYEEDIQRILAAFHTDSKSERDTLARDLRMTPFIRAVDFASGMRKMCRPDEVYIPTQRLRELFSGIPSVFFVDGSCRFLQGNDIRNLLEACGATAHLRRVNVEPEFTPEQLYEMRVNRGQENSTRDISTEDYTLHGLSAVLELLPTLDETSRRRRAQLLWDALVDLERRSGRSAFYGIYKWCYYRREYSWEFPARFVRDLNQAAWLPGQDGRLKRPELVSFGDLGWEPSPVLESIIHFRPRVIHELAQQVGIEPDVLYLLKEHGITTSDRLREVLDASSSEPTEKTPVVAGSYSQSSTPQDVGQGDSVTQCLYDGDSGESRSSRSVQGGAIGKGVDDLCTDCVDDRYVPVPRTPAAAQVGPHGVEEQVSPRQFVSYVAVHPSEYEPDHHGWDPAARLELEERAIRLVLHTEPRLRRTSFNNPGFDLFESADDGTPLRWVEVKAMSGTMRDRPVALSKTQFDFARERGEAYWLYVVENADSDSPRIRRIRDPAGRAQAFTFDHGWLCISDSPATNV